MPMPNWPPVTVTWPPPLLPTPIQATLQTWLQHLPPTLTPAVPQTPAMQNSKAWPPQTWPQMPVQNRHYVPPHEQQPIPHHKFNRIYSLTDDDDDDDGTTTTTSSQPLHPPTHQHLLWPDLPAKQTIKEKTMAGVPPWPTNLCLSLSVNNWLEWSHHLLASLSMGQLDVYPLGKLKCPECVTDPIGCKNWQGNNGMVLGFMTTHMFPAKSQYITTCMMSVAAYSLLHQ